MNDKLKEIFNQIQAEEELKNSTRAFLAQKTQGYTRTISAKHQYRIYTTACICILFILIGAHWLYFTPTAEISMDINPSIELSINRFDQVISANGYNDDGLELAHALDVKFINYTDAIEQILSNKNIAALLSNNEIMTITVTGPNRTRSSKILSGIEACTAEQRNTYCYFASSEEVAAAHEMGLSYGKYRAFLEVQILDPSITPEIIQDMTMREIHNLIHNLSNGKENETLLDDNRGYRHRGLSSGHRGKEGNERKRCRNGK
ncbi:hypothetical protein AALB16_12380 [Lachnospiraceae bacterium 62-35]